MVQRIGEYRDKVVIQQRSDTRDAAGEPIPGWASFATRWASRRILSGGEGFEEDVARQGELMVEFRTHLTRGIGDRMRVLYPGAVTTLASGVSSAGDTTLKVNDSSGFPRQNKYRIRVEDELMEVTATSGGTTTWTVERGADSTTAAASYATGTPVTLMQAHDIEAAHIDWKRGAETVIQARLNDGVA